MWKLIFGPLAVLGILIYLVGFAAGMLFGVFIGIELEVK